MFQNNKLILHCNSHVSRTWGWEQCSITALSIFMSLALAKCYTRKNIVIPLHMEGSLWVNTKSLPMAKKLLSKVVVSIFGFDIFLCPMRTQVCIFYLSYSCICLELFPQGRNQQKCMTWLIIYGHYSLNINGNILET